MRHELNSPTVAYEDFSSDAVLLDLSSGSYFSLADRAKAFFEQLIACDSTEGLVAALRARDPEAGRLAEMTVERLTSEGLVREVPSDAGAGDFAAACDAILAAPEAFTFESFSDLADVIAADPIHDFDTQTGMPVARHA
jgi:hypothetical protein